MAKSPQRKTSDPDLTKEIRELAAEVVAEPDRWLSTPNSQFDGKRPSDLIGTDREQLVRDLLRAVKHGMFT